MFWRTRHLPAGRSQAGDRHLNFHDYRDNLLLTTYAHVMPKDDDRVRSIVDETLAGSAEDWLRTAAV